MLAPVLVRRADQFDRPRQLQLFPLGEDFDFRAIRLSREFQCPLRRWRNVRDSTGAGHQNEFTYRWQL